MISPGRDMIPSSATGPVLTGLFLAATSAPHHVTYPVPSPTGPTHRGNLPAPVTVNVTVEFPFHDHLPEVLFIFQPVDRDERRERDLKIISGHASPAARRLVARATGGGIRSGELHIAFEDEE